MIGSNRDALIPQPDNRLLFTQSQVPWIRILGQFLSWAQAKSTQTNKILMRVESGDARQLIKTLAVIPVYGGIQQLREIAKYGEVHTHPDYDMSKFLAKAGQLSGMPGWLVDLFMNRFLGPGKRDPWFNFAPAFSIMGSAGTAVKQVLDKKPDQAMQTLSKRFLPLPNWRRWIKRWWFDLPKLKGTDVGTKVTFSKGGRIGYEQGDVARQNFSIGKIASKLAANYLIKRDRTAINTTIGTYKKANKILTDLNKKNVHDFGAGTGLGTRQLKNKKVTSHEPFVSDEKILQSGGKVPTYKSIDDVLTIEGKASKDGIVNLNVLNVIENPIERNIIVKNIGELLSDDGIAIITTRGKEVATQAKNSKNAIPFSDGWLFGTGSSKTFQKGFSQKELQKYIQEILGKLFKVEKIPSKYDIKTTGVMITKLKKYSLGGQVARLGLSGGDIVDTFERKFNRGGRIGYEQGEEVILPRKKPSLTSSDKLDIIEMPIVDEEEKVIENPLIVTENQLNKGKEISNIIKTKLDDREIKNSENIAAGITGNIFAENPKFISTQEEIGDINKLKDKQRGYGLFQFTDYKNKKGELVGHKTEYNKYLKNKNKEDSAESQIDYVLDNIFAKGSGLDIGAQNKEMLKLTFSEGNASNIAEIFMILWERPHNDSSLDDRINFAKKLFVDN